MNTTLISKEIINGTAYFTTVKGGTEYCAHFNEIVGKWFVGTRRIALGRMNAGSGKYFDKVEDCKAFAALPVFMNMQAI